MAAHGLLTAAALSLARRRFEITPTAARATVVASVAPDVLHALPVLAWALFAGHGALSLMRDYAFATPGREPWLPQWVAFSSHHLHCMAHSAIAAALVTQICWLAVRTVPIALLGWWSHIVIDLFTHSADFYPAPVLYPLSDWTFDGLAWNRPEVLVSTYLMLGLTWGWLAHSARRS